MKFAFAVIMQVFKRYSIVAVLILFGLLEPLLGQGGFVKRHFPKGLHNSVCRDVFEAPDGNIIGVGITSDSTLGGGRLTILGMDKNGNKLWLKSYGHKNVYYYDNDVHYRGPALCDSTGFYLLLLAADTISPRTFGVLMKVDYNGDTLWTKEYRSKDTLEDVMPQAIYRSRDGGFLFTGLFQFWGQPAYSNVLIIKANNKGEKLWEQKIGKAVPNVHDGKSIAQDSATGRIVVVGYQYLGSSTYQTTFGNIIIADSLGNKLHQTTYNNSNGGAFTEVIQLRDKNFLTCGSYNANSDLGNLTRYYSLVVKFDIYGNKIWEKKYDGISPINHIGVMHELPDESLLLAGSLDTMLNHNIFADSRVKLIKVDKNGNIKWRKNIGSGVNDEIPMSIRSTKDKGFLLALRDVFSSAPNPFNIVKIDSTGCDTAEAYCKFLDGFTGFAGETRNVVFSVYPNPANDYVTVSVGDAYYTKSTIWITDMTGRVIQSSHLNEASNAIDITSLNNGMYFISVLQGEKPVETRKLAVFK